MKVFCCNYLLFTVLILVEFKPQNLECKEEIKLFEHHTNSLSRLKRDNESSLKNFIHSDEYVYNSVSEKNANAQEYCVLGDSCGSGGGLAGDSNIPCLVKKSSRQLNDSESLEMLRGICPSLFKHSSNPHLCCLPNDVKEMFTNFANPRDLGMGKCPSCMANFRTIYCELICSPKQASFVHVTDVELVTDFDFLKKFEPGDNEDEKNITHLIPKEEQYVAKEVNYFLNQDFAFTLYESCRNVKSSLGGSLIDVLCGSPPCNPQKWLNYMGLSYTRKGFAPFQINYILVKAQFYENIHSLIEINKLNLTRINQNILYKPVLSNQTSISPMNAKYYQCYERISDEIGTCACADCEQTCKVIKKSALSNPGKPLLMSGRNFTLFLGWLLFAILVLAVTTYFVSISRRKHQSFNLDFSKEQVVEEEKFQSKQTLPYVNSLTSIFKTSDKHENELFEMTFSLKLEAFFHKIFQRWALIVATYPYKVLFCSLFCSIFLSMGTIFYKVTTDPIDLWVAKDSQARQDMQYFNDNFWKFYRIEQIILAPKNNYTFKATYTDEDGNNHEKMFSSLFEREILQEAFQLQQAIEKLTTINQYKKIIKLQDICYQPLPGKCATQSFFTYFGNNMENLFEKNYLERIMVCPENPTYLRSDMSCMERNGIPLIYPEVALGGFGERQFSLAQALIITFPVNNYNSIKQNQDAFLWENEFLKFIQNYIANNKSHFRISFKAEKSIEDEINRQSESDVFTIVVSYVIMFIYILMTLGENDRDTLLLNTKFTVGFAGVIVVLLSVIASLGFFFYLGISATLIIVEVIPFLVLAVGVDNLFILVQSYYRDVPRENEDLNSQIARVCGEVFPSMLLSSTSMCACFFIGSYTPMPAVQMFALYAAVALFINFFLQMTCFLAIFILDVHRSKANRLDIFCCFVWNAKNQKNNLQTSSNAGNELNDDNKNTNLASIKPSSVKTKETLHSFFAEIYAPFLMKDHVRLFVLIIFACWLCNSLIVISSIHVGLEQELSVPDDSYMANYFDMYKQYFEVGPPVYFMIKSNSFNLSITKNQNIICSLNNCEPDSILQLLNYWSDKQKLESYLSTTPTYFLDNYINYLKNSYCCLKYVNNTQCFDNIDNSCSPCLPESETKLPNPEQFSKYLNFFFNHIPNEDCILGGKAQFLPSVNLNSDQQIKASYITTYNTPLKTSEDFYEALRQSRVVADRLTQELRTKANNLDVVVRPYSFPHVFYEQYLTMWQETIISLSMSIGTIFIVNSLFFGFDFYSALISSFTITMIIINLMGMMYWWDISLNAISLVNLVVGVGISVEFVSHLLMQYKLSPQPTKLFRARDCLAKMGSSVLSGITLTDCGILVLAFAKSKIFQVFYFRMYLGMIVFGTLHSLVLLPVLLSLIGPSLDRNRFLLNKMNEPKKIINDHSYSV